MPIDHYFVNFEELVLLGLRTFSKKAERRAVRVRKGRCGAAALRALLLEFLPLDERRRREGRIWFGFLSRAAAEAAPGLDRGAALDSLLAFELAATVQAILDGGVDEALLERRGGAA